MPVVLKYDVDSKILRVIVHGELQLNEMASVFHQITTSEEYPPNVDTLWDLLNADLGPTSTAFWQTLIEMRKQHHPQRKNFRLALVASTDFSFGMLRMYEMLSESHLHRELTVFREISEAEQWILQGRTKPTTE